MVTENPDTGVVALTTKRFEFNAGGGFKATARIEPLHLVTFNRKASTWDAKYVFKVRAWDTHVHRGAGFPDNRASAKNTRASVSSSRLVGTPLCQPQGQR